MHYMFKSTELPTKMNPSSLYLRRMPNKSVYDSINKIPIKISPVRTPPRPTLTNILMRYRLSD